MGYSKTGVISYKKKPEKGEPGPKGPFVYPAGIYVQGSDTKYTATALTAPMVVFENQMYILNVVGTVGSDLNPKEDYAANGSKATWVLMPQYKAAYYEIFFAEFAKLGSAIFSGDYMLSQHGVDENGQPSTRYDLFGEQTVDGKDKFAPNISIDWLTGKFSGKNVDIEGKIKGKDADIDGRVVAKSGKVGSWQINGSMLISGNFVPPKYENWDAKGGKGSCISSDGALMISPSYGGMFVSGSGATLAAVINAISDHLFVHGLHLRAECTDQYEGGRDARVCALEIYAGHVNSNRDHAPMAINVKQGHSRFTGTSSVPAWRGGEITITSEISTLVVNQKQITIRAHRDLEDGHDLTIINVMDNDGVEIYGDIYSNAGGTIHKINSRCCKTMKFLGGKFYPQSYY